MVAVSHSPARSITRAIFAVILTALFFAISDAFAQVQTRHLPPLEVGWLRYVCFSVFLLLWYRSNLVGIFATRTLFWQIGRGLFTVVSAISFVGGLQSLPLGDATAIAFAAPFIIMALSVPLLGEHVGLRRWLIAGVGLAGVLIIVRPGTSAFQWAALLPLLAAICSSLGILATRLMQNESPAAMLVYTAGVGLLVLSVLVPFGWVMPGREDVLPILATGVAAALANVTLIAAYRNVPVSIAAPFSYIQLVFAGLLGFLISGTIPTPVALVGAAIIAFSGIFGAYQERREASAVRASV